MEKREQSEQAEKDMWEDEIFLIEAELQCCDIRSRYELLMRRLDKIMEKE